MLVSQLSNVIESHDSFARPFLHTAPRILKHGVYNHHLDEYFPVLCATRGGGSFFMTPGVITHSADYLMLVQHLVSPL